MLVLVLVLRHTPTRNPNPRPHPIRRRRPHRNQMRRGYTPSRAARNTIHRPRLRRRAVHYPVHTPIAPSRSSIKSSALLLLRHPIHRRRARPLHPRPQIPLQLPHRRRPGQLQVRRDLHPLHPIPHSPIRTTETLRKRPIPPSRLKRSKLVRSHTRKDALHIRDLLQVHHPIYTVLELLLVIGSEGGSSGRGIDVVAVGQGHTSLVL